MEQRKNYLQYNLDSRFSSNSDLNNPNFIYNNIGFSRSSKLKIVECSIPLTFYKFTSSNNTLVVQENVGASFNVSITPGNYTNTTIATELTTRLNAASVNARTYTCSVSTTTGKLTISVSAGTFAILSTSNSQCLRFLGLVASGQTSTKTGSYVVDLNPSKYIHLVSNSLSSGLQNQSSVIDTTPNSIVVETFYNNRNSYENLYWKVRNPQDYYLADDDLDSISFYLMDDAGNVLDLNGASFSVKIAFYNGE